MKGEKRQVYLMLIGEIGWTLCGFCKYANWYGSSCCDAYCECEHPLDAISDGVAIDIDPTTDCWGFRPRLNVSDMADVVGLMLSRFKDGAVSWHKEKDGRIIVHGQTLHPEAIDE